MQQLLSVGIHESISCSLSIRSTYLWVISICWFQACLFLGGLLLWTVWLKEHDPLFRGCLLLALFQLPGHLGGVFDLLWLEIGWLVMSFICSDSRSVDLWEVGTHVWEDKKGDSAQACIQLRGDRANTCEKGPTGCLSKDVHHDRTKKVGASLDKVTRLVLPLICTQDRQGVSMQVGGRQTRWLEPNMRPRGWSWSWRKLKGRKTRYIKPNMCPRDKCSILVFCCLELSLEALRRPTHVWGRSPPLSWHVCVLAWCIPVWRKSHVGCALCLDVHIRLDIVQKSLAQVQGRTTLVSWFAFALGMCSWVWCKSSWRHESCPRRNMCPRETHSRLSWISSLLLKIIFWSPCEAGTSRR